jgi:hypothetical protein
MCTLGKTGAGKRKEKNNRHSHFTYLHIEDAMMCTVMATVFHSLGY